MTEIDIKSKLDGLALDLAEHARKDTSTFNDKLDAFKALTAYYQGNVKLKKKDDGEEKPEEGETFNGFRKSVEASG